MSATALERARRGKEWQQHQGIKAHRVVDEGVSGGRFEMRVFMCPSPHAHTFLNAMPPPITASVVPMIMGTGCSGIGEDHRGEK